MPEIGEIKKGCEIGREKDAHKWVWSPCSNCGKCRWIRLEGGKSESAYCVPCVNKLKKVYRGSESHFWKGGRIQDGKGYIKVLLQPDDFYRSMIKSDSYIYEHRLVMAKHLNRCLHRWEIVHHKNGIKDDNRLENLELAMRGSHTREHSKGYKDGYLKGLYDGHEKRIKELEARITLLEAENTLLGGSQLVTTGGS